METDAADTAFVLTHESNPERRVKSMSMIALAITRSLGRRGVPVVRLHPNLLDHSLSSRYCRKVETCPDFYASEPALVKYLLALRPRYPGKAVLIPASDDCAYFVARHHAALSPHYRIAAPPWSVMESLLDKRRQYENAQRLGIPIPETYFPTSLEEVRALAGGLANYPYVIKPLVAHSWRLASMQGVAKGKKGFSAANARELVDRYASIANGDGKVMIQEVIGGKDDRLFTFLCYFDERSEPMGYCVRKKIRQFPVDFGYCTLTESCLDETVVDQSIRLLKGIGYHGLAGVEWKLDPRTGLYKLIEINARAVNTIAIAPACGVDLPYIAFADKTGHPPAPALVWKPGIKWLNLEQDFWAARELHRAGKLSSKEWRSSLAGRRVHPIFAADDPRPFIGYFADFIKRTANSLLAGRRRSTAAGAPGDATPATKPLPTAAATGLPVSIAKD